MFGAWSLRKSLLSLNCLIFLIVDDIDVKDALTLAQDLVARTENITGDRKIGKVLGNVAPEVKVEVHPGPQQDRMFRVTRAMKGVRENHLSDSNLVVYNIF